MRAKINGIELFITVSGNENQPALILNHSLATSHEMWGLQRTLFARHFRTVAFDMRGHGASAAPSGAYSLEQLADDVVGVADHLGIQRFHYLGLSIGGIIGQVLGHRHGARLGKLILSSTTTGTVGAAGEKAWTERNALVKAQGPRSQIEGTMARWLSADFQQAATVTAQWIRDLIAATPTDGYVGCGEAIKAMQLTADKLSTIKAPTLVIAGEKDPGATPAEAARIAAAIPGAATFTVPGGYHLCNVEFPHVFAERVLAFLLDRRLPEGVSPRALAMSVTSAPTDNPLQRAAPVFFVLLWATGFLVAKYAIPYAAPFTILTIRFAIASVMMAVIGLVFGARWPKTWTEFAHIAMTGILLQAVYLGGCYAAIYAGLPSGMVALIAGLQPIVTAALAGPLLGERLKVLQWLGAALGFIGLTMVIWHKLAFDTGHLWALFFAFVQLFGITAATLYQKRFSPNADLKAGAAIQYAAATLVLFPVMLGIGIGEIQWVPEFIIAMAWIVIVLSGISIALLTWMIQRGAASKVASLFYLTPPVAALGGYLMFDERLDVLAFCGMGVVALGVFLVNRK